MNSRAGLQAVGGSRSRVVLSQKIAPAVQHVVVRQCEPVHLDGKGTRQQDFGRRLCRHNRDLGRHEARRQPSPNHRPALDRFPRDQGLQDGTHTRSRRVTIAAFLDRPTAIDDADDCVGGRCDAFFRDHEHELTGTRGSQPGEQPPLRVIAYLTKSRSRSR